MINYLEWGMLGYEWIFVVEMIGVLGLGIWVECFIDVKDLSKWVIWECSGRKCKFVIIKVLNIRLL